MPKSTPRLIAALNEALGQLRSGARYEWGHVGHCNCGHLVQAALGQSPREIYREFGQDLSEWSEHGDVRCDRTDLPIDAVFESLRAIGFEREDVLHLENLSDPEILRHLPGGRRYLQRNQREDVILYLETMVALLEGVEPRLVNERIPDQRYAPVES